MIKEFFSRSAKNRISCAGCALDHQQTAAVLANEDAQLVLAAAGSGKTLCLLAKVEYLAGKLKIPPRAILVISFTNKTVAELKERCSVENVEIRTFHSLGRNILKHSTSTRYKKAKLIDENQIATFLSNTLVSLAPLVDEFADSLDDFLSLLATFLSLYKNGGWDEVKLRRRLEEYYRPPKASELFARFFRGEAPPDRTARIAAKQRVERFIVLFFEIYRRYESWLAHQDLYDFSDMINAARLAVENEPSAARGYRYILVDEVQDLSKNRCALVRAILKKNPGCKLFAVGDDWQSIYRFTGSDLGLVHHFEKIFGLKTRRSFIENTHRFGKPLLNISGEFIQKNPRQSPKRVRAPKDRTTGLFIAPNLAPTLRLRRLGQDAATLGRLLFRLLKEQGEDRLRASSLQVISRYNSDVDRLRDGDSFEIGAKLGHPDVFTILWRPNLKTTPFSLEFCSMHKAKGITRDYVFVLNVNDGPHGIPSRRLSDPIIDLLLVDSEKYPFAEERRLFYVAITRARRATFLICDRASPSPFLFELSEEFKEDFAPSRPQISKLKLLLSRFFIWANYALTPVCKKVLQLFYGKQHAQTNCAEPA